MTKRSKEEIIQQIKILEEQLATLTLELEETLGENEDYKKKTPKGEPTVDDFQVGDKVKVLTKGVVSFDSSKTYTVIGETRKRVEIKIDCGTIIRAPTSLRKIA